VELFDGAARPGHELKSSLKAITEELTQDERRRLGSLVGAAFRDDAQTVQRRTSSVLDSGDGACGEGCLDSLARRLPAASSTSSGSVPEGEGKYTVGEERMRREEAKSEDGNLKQTFIGAQKRRMRQSISQGWGFLDKGELSRAKQALSEAKAFHRRMIQILRGSPRVAQYLNTPRSIVRLQNAIDAGEAKSATASLSSQALGNKLPKFVAPQPSRHEGTPRRLEKIMETHYSSHHADKSTRLDKIWNHFSKDQLHISKVSLSQAEDVTLPSNSPSSSGSIADLASNFEALASKQISKGIEAAKAGYISDAEQSLKKADFYVQGALSAKKGSKEAELPKLLMSKMESLKHMLQKYVEDRKAKQREELEKNLKVLKAPIQYESLKEFAVQSGPTEGQRLKSDKEKFAHEIRGGVDAVKAGDLEQAQSDLVQARYYAKRQGLLGDSSKLVTDTQKHNAQVAQSALKILSDDIVKAEVKREDPSKGRWSLKSLLGPSYSSRGRRDGKLRDKKRESYAGKLYSSGTWWKHKVVHAGDQSSTVDGSFAGLPGLHTNKDFFERVNGEEEDQQLADHKAIRNYKSQCNTVDCLFSKVATEEQNDGTGFGVDRSIDDVLDNDGLKNDDFSSKGTHMHTGMHLNYRVSHRGMTHGGSGIPKLNLHGVGDLSAAPKSDVQDGGATADASVHSVMDTGNLVRGQEAADLSHSMQAAMKDYQKLLKHEVKKEEQRSLSMPFLAIESPKGAPLLPSLSGTSANPAHVKLSALKDHGQAHGKGKTQTAPARFPQAQTDSKAHGAEALMNQLLKHAKFQGGPWDAQEQSAAAEAPMKEAARSRPRVSQQEEQPVVKQEVGVVEQPPHAPAPRVVRRLPARRQTNPVDVAGMLINDIGQDLGFS